VRREQIVLTSRVRDTRSADINIRARQFGSALRQQEPAVPIEGLKGEQLGV
jgi:hypothetical protein